MPIIRIQNLNDADRVMNRTKRTVDDRFKVTNGDLLVSWSATLDAFLWQREDAWLNQHIFKVIPNLCVVDRRFLLFLLKNEIENLKKTEHLHGSTMMHINRSPFLAHLVPLPPLETQVEVAASIDQLFTEIDDGEAALARARSDLTIWRKSLLKAAVTGDLTADWRAANPPTETGADLLTRILAERWARWDAEPKNRGKRYVEPPRTNASMLPRLPSSWVWADINQLSTLVTSGSRGWAEHYAKAGPLFIRAQNINTDTLVLENVAHVNPPSGAEGARTKLAKSDILVTITGANVTKAAVVKHDLGEAFVSQHVGLIRPLRSELANFLYWWIVTPDGGRGVLEELAYGAGKPGLNLPNLFNLAVPLPPIEEQRMIVEWCEAVAGGNESLTAECAEAAESSATLRQSILAAAFSGKLVA